MAPTMAITHRFSSMKHMLNFSAFFLLAFVAGCTVLTRTNFAVEKAIKKGDIKRLEIYLKSGTEVNAQTEQGFSLLETAVMYKRYAIVELLLKRGAKIPDSQLNPFSIFAHCFKTNDIRMLKLLLDSGYDVNKEFHGITLLDKSTEYPHTRLTKEIIDRGADVNPVSNVTFRTPLYSAIFFNNFDTVKMLLERGANPCVLDSSGISPYCESMEYADRPIQKLLQGCPEKFEICKK